jgi:farnesyl-diphosphate farnesyltransferase
MRPLRSAPSPGQDTVVALTPGELSSLLDRTSRTFALTIPLLDEPLATDVGLAYLLFRIADTLEDAPLWGRDKRKAALDSFGEWLGAPAPGGHHWMELVEHAAPIDDAGCLALLARADGVREAVAQRGPEIASAMTADVGRTTAKMAEFVARQTEDGGLVLTDLADLRAYCYAVAGIVGELLTEMFLIRDPSLAPRRSALMELAPAFGEGLQLVNILKDAPSDAGEGRKYLPPGVAHADVMHLARNDLARANDYVDLLKLGGASSHVCTFCELPVRLAEATLDRLEEGAAKLSRQEVMTIFTKVTSAAPPHSH